MQTNIDVMKGISFDSSLSNIDASVTPEEYRMCLTSLLQPILDKTFQNNKGKTKIRPYRDRLSFACPYCMDSMKSDYKKRGNFILLGRHSNYFKCFNCGQFRRIDKFFEDFHVTLNLNVINYIANGIEDFSTYNSSKYDMSIFADMESIETYAIDRQEFLKYFGLIEVKDSSVWPWLKYRLQYDTQKFMYNNRQNYLVILNLTPNGKILGVQKRMFKGEDKYLTRKLVMIYELMKKDPKIIPEQIDNISQIFNICLINYARPITLFEGPLDSFLFKNSIANTGIHKAFPIDIPIRLFFDDDKDGRNKSIEHINEGHEVFLWTKFKTKFELPDRKKWDLNDCLIYFHENKIKTPDFNVYFSNDPLDIIDI